MEIQLEHGECISFLGIVLQKWEKDFTDLFSGCNNSFDDSLKELMECNMMTDGNNCNMFMSTKFSKEEVKNVIL